MFYTIYKITNKINGKEYTGKHITNDLEDGYMGSGKHIKRAINKHGIENFIKEIIHIFDNELDMNIKEAELVTEEYCNRKNTYNLCPGGHGGFGYINMNNLSNTEELKIQKSIKMKDYWSEEKRQEKSESMKKYNQINGTERYSTAASKRYEDIDFLEEFVKTMTLVNQCEEKRKKAGIKIKEKWQEEEYRNKTLQSRIGIFWWNNGMKIIKSRNCPGEGWVRGRSNKNLGRKRNETNKD